MGPMRPLVPVLTAAALVGGGIAGIAHAAEDGARSAVVRPAVASTALAIIGTIDVGAAPLGLALTSDDSLLVAAVSVAGTQYGIDDTILGTYVATINPRSVTGAPQKTQAVTTPTTFRPKGIEIGDDTAVMVGSLCATPQLIDSCDDTMSVVYWSVSDDTQTATREITGAVNASGFAVSSDGLTVVAGTAADDSLIIIPTGGANQFVPLDLPSRLNVNSDIAITADDTVWFMTHFGPSTTYDDSLGYFALDDTSTVTQLGTACPEKSPSIALSATTLFYLSQCRTQPYALASRSVATTAQVASRALNDVAVSDLSVGLSHVLMAALDVNTEDPFLAVINPLDLSTIGSVATPAITLESVQDDSGVIYAAQAFGPDLIWTESVLAIDDVGVSGLSISGGSAGTATSFDVTATSGSTWDDTTIESVTFGGASVPFSRTGNTITATAPTGSGSVPVVVTFNGGNSLTVGTFSYPSPPPPPPVFPPSAPRDVTAVPGDGSATVEWLVPSSSGSFPISTYQVRSTPESAGCLTADLTCEVTGLANGTAYSFEVRALNGAGWGPWSSASEPVTPAVAKSIVITGSREGRVAKAVGQTTGLVGEQVTPWVRFPGPKPYAPGTGVRTVDAEGRFAWERQTGKKIYVYFAAGDVRSNRVIIRR